MKTMKMIRQGDVMLVKVEGALPTGPGLGSEKTNKLTIALGEATGHHHTLYGDTPSCSLLEVGGERFVEVDAAVWLRHQEHDECRILPGVYKIIIEKERDPFEKIMKKVVD